MIPAATFLVATILCTLFSTLRTAPLWLSVQALALAWISALHHGTDSLHGAMTVIELVVVRAIVAPGLLRRAVGRTSAPSSHLLPSNLLVWILAISLIVLAFQFAVRAKPGEQAIIIGSVAATVSLALLLLASNDSGAAQLCAVLLLENAASLFESLLILPWSPWVHTSLSCAYVLTILVAGRFVGQSDDEPAAASTRQVL